MIILIILILPFLIAFICGIYKGIVDYMPINEEIEVDEDVENEIAMIQCNINRRIESACILENELKKEDLQPLKKARLLNQLNTLDKQTFKDYKRIDDLKQLEDGG